MLQTVIIITVFIIIILIILFLLLAVLRRMRSARVYQKLDIARAHYRKIIEEAFLKDNTVEIINELLSRPGTLKFRAIEEVLFELKERFPEKTKNFFIRLGYVEFYGKTLLKRSRLKQASAIDKLGRMGIESSVSKIAPFLKKKDREIISVTVRALSNIGTDLALITLLEDLLELYENWLITRKAVETALLKFGDKGSELLIKYGLNLKNPKILAVVLDSLSHSNNSKALSIAMENINHNDPEVRTKALKVVGRFHNHLSDDDIYKICRLSKDSVWFVRLHVAKILGHLDNKIVVDHLERLLRDENWQVRDEAARGLSRQRDFPDIILKMFNEKDLYAIESLCEAIEKAGLHEELIKNLINKDSGSSEKSRQILKTMHSLGFSTPLIETIKSSRDKTIVEELKLITGIKA